jgi:hypothetical protein
MTASSKSATRLWRPVRVVRLINRPHVQDWDAAGANAVVTPRRGLGLFAFFPAIMATLLPPPKRQKVYHGVPEPAPEPLKASPNIVVQFVSEENGTQLAPAVNLPANVSRDELQALVNNLAKNVRCFRRLKVRVLM